MTTDRKITQEFFDEQVTENMALFGCDLDEAIDETVKSFEAQNVNLFNIIPELIKYEDEDPLVNALTKLNLGQTDQTILFDDISKELKKGLPYRMRAAQKGALKTLHKVIRDNFKKNVTICCYAAESLGQLVISQPDIMTAAILTDIVTWIEDLTSPPPEEAAADAETKLDFIAQLLRVCEYSCQKHEANREILAKKGMLLNAVELASDVLKCHPEKRNEVIICCCRLLRTLTQDDDIRVEFGKGNDFAITLAANTKLLENFSSLIKTSLKSSEDFDLLSELMQTLACVMIREEYCLRFQKNGGVELLCFMLDLYHHQPKIIGPCLGLLNAISRADDCKLAFANWKSACESENHESYPALSALVRLIDEYMSNATLVKNACLLISSITLRQTTIASKMVESGVAPVLVKVLQNYVTNGPICRAACMAIRNCVCRLPELREHFVPYKAIVDGKNKEPLITDSSAAMAVETLGLEELLNKATNDPRSRDEAVSALRDLGCKTKLNESWTTAAVKQKN